MMEEIQQPETRDDVVVSVCRLHPIKGLSYALQAVARVRNDFPTLEYIVVGHGPLEADLRAEAIQLGIDDCVRLTDSMTNFEACKLTRQAAVFLLPLVIASDDDRDSSPTAIAEALALEVPIISSSISGIPELVDGITGILKPSCQVDEIARALRRLLSERALRAQMGRAGKQQITAEFAVERNTEQLLRTVR